MPELTPAERRGARWFVALLLVGALHDLTRARFPAWAPPADEAGHTAAERSEAPGATSPAVPTPAAPAEVTDLNRATAPELDRLPGIGPVLARRIVEHRERHGPFRSPDELLGVPGIGPRLLERLRPHVSAGR